MLWATGNFSLFIRPGMWRISLDREPEISELEAATSLMSSAYTDGEKVVLVFINYEDKQKEVKIRCGNSTKGKMFVTDMDKNLEYTGEHKLSELIIAPKAVVTVVI